METEHDISKEDLVDERVAARILSMSPHSLKAMRHDGRGPAFYRLGSKTIRYAMSDLNAFVQRVES